MPRYARYSILTICLWHWWGRMPRDAPWRGPAQQNRAGGEVCFWWGLVLHAVRLRMWKCCSLPWYECITVMDIGINYTYTLVHNCTHVEITHPKNHTIGGSTHIQLRDTMGNDDSWPGDVRCRAVSRHFFQQLASTVAKQFWCINMY